MISHSPYNEDALPYAPFLALGGRRRGIAMVGAMAAVVAFGFVPVPVQLAGGSGWPLHDVLHPLLGLFLGPVYGPISAVVGAAMSEILSPHTALSGWSPVAAGMSSMSAALLVRSRRAGMILGVGMGVLVGGGVWGELVQSSSLLGRSAWLLPGVGALGLLSVGSVRSWARRHLVSVTETWKTGAALWLVCFVGSSFGLVPLWGVTLLGGTVGGVEAPLLFVAMRVLLALIGALVGLVFWPALQRRLFSVANQLRYGLPLFILATFLFAGRLFLDQAYQTAQVETTKRLRDQSQTVVRTLDTELDRMEHVLRTSSGGAAADRTDLFEWVVRLPAADTTFEALSGEAWSLVGQARQTGHAKRSFLAMPDTAGYGIGIAVPVSGVQRESDGQVVLACVGPSQLQRVLSIWAPVQSQLYLVNHQREPVIEPEGAPPVRTRRPDSLVQALLAAPGATAEAPQGRYNADVLGAIAPLTGLPGYVVVEQTQDDAYAHVFGMLVTMVLITLLACAGALTVGFYVSQRVVAPLDRLIDAARRVGDGTLSVEVKVEQDNELGELARTFNTMTRDLSESMQRLRTSEERLRIALDAARMGTWNWTMDPERMAWSPQTYALLDVPRSRDGQLFSAFLERVHPDDRPRVLDRIRSVVDEQTEFAIEHRIRTTNAQNKWVRLQGRVYREDGRPQRMSGVIANVTTRKKAELEMKAAKEEAEEMSRLKSAFLANVSHEIRTPLTSIIGFAEVLVEEMDDAHREGAKKILKSGHRLMQTLDSVLDLSMIEAGEFSLDCRPFDLAGEIRQRAELLRPSAERKGLNFQTDVPSSPIEVHLDPNCLDRILTNLLTNAIKFTDSGHVEVRVRAAASSVVLEVIDSGIGIDDAFQSDLFEAFKQESGGLQREHQGTGLGLSITKELVDMMEGRIEVRSTKGEGTIVTVRFPYRVSDQHGHTLNAGSADETKPTV